MNTSAAQSKERRPSRTRRVAILAALGFLIAVGILIYSSFLRHPVGGHVRLGTAHGESELELYVGNRLVGHNRADVPWSDIFGWTGQQNLGIVLPDNVVPVDDDASDGSVGEITAERLAGQGAEILHVSDGIPMWSSNAGRQEFSKKEILLRRSDGKLDHVFCLDGRLNDLFGNPHRVLVPIRVRSRGGTDVAYFTTESRGTPGGRFANVLNRTCPEWNFERADPPAEFAQEIKAQGLWRPSN